MSGTVLFAYDTTSTPNVVSMSWHGMAHPRLISTIGMLTVGQGAAIADDYVLQADLIAEVKFEDNQYVVVDYRVDEYGVGDTLSEAQQDLFESLVDYLKSLEKREDRLGNKDSLNLQVLRGMLKRA